MTLLSDLQAAGLPVISAEESGAITMGAMSDEQQIIFLNVLLQRQNPTAYALMQADQTDSQAVKDTYQTAINQLQTIEAFASPTNAQVIAAVKQIATILRLLLKFLARYFR